MDNNNQIFTFEKERLMKTIETAKFHLNESIEHNECNKSEILSVKKDLHENTMHAILNPYASGDFEGLVEISQFVNPMTIKIKEYESLENKIRLLKSIIKSPYFARIDFKYDDEDEPEKIYIGRASLTKENSYEMLIYDWRSPIASVFYRFVGGEAYYDAPAGRIHGELNLKRQYEIKDGKLEYFFESDVQIVDEFLRKMLSKNTSSKMKTIVETIQKEQDIIIRDMQNELMIVQGVAGSGKTSIALHRAAFLMYSGLNSKLSANNILIISPNSVFEKYISEVLPELGEDNVSSLIFDEILDDILRKKKIQKRNEFIEVLFTNNYYYDLMKSSLEFKTSTQYIKILNEFIKILPEMIEFEDIYYGEECLFTKRELKDRVFSWRDDVPLRFKLVKLKEIILESAADARKRKRVRYEFMRIKNDIERFIKIDYVYYYKKFFSKKSNFFKFAVANDLPKNIDAIFEYTKDNLSNEQVYYDDASAILYTAVKTGEIKDYADIRQVVIDEAQDYYPIHFEIFKELFKHAKYTILGDFNQTIAKTETINFYEEIVGIIDKKRSSLVIMDKSFRCTNEILSFSSNFIPNNIEVKSFNRQGEEPKIYIAENQNQLCDMLVNEVKHSLNEGYETIGLICKTEKKSKELFEKLKDKIEVKLINSESSDTLKGVFIIPLCMSKGLEFDSVLICDADYKTYKNEEDKKLLYIAGTRALHRLNIFCEDNLSSLII